MNGQTHTQTPPGPLRPNFLNDEATAAHHAALSATSFEEYTAGVELDEHGRPPVGTVVVATPYYQVIAGVVAGTRGKVNWLFMNHTTPTFEVKWDAYTHEYHGAKPEEVAWFTASDILRYDLFARFTRVEFYAQRFEEGSPKYYPFPSLREAAQWVLDNADWSEERGEGGKLTRSHSAVYMTALGGRYTEGVERVGVASNYCRRALEIAVETNNWRVVIRRCKEEGLDYES